MERPSARRQHELHTISPETNTMTPLKISSTPRHTLSLAAALLLGGGCLSDDGKGDTITTSAADPSTTKSATESASSTDPSSSTSADTAATDTAAGSETDTNTDTGCTFLACDTTSGHGDAMCDVWRDDCPSGTKCMPWASDGGNSWNVTKCAPLDPNPVKPGDPCKVEGNGLSGLDNCEAGAMCWNVNSETLEGYCVGFCDGSPDSYTCAEPKTTCTLYASGVLILCLPNCDPLLQDCPDSDLCLWGGYGFICALDASGEAGQFGDPCEFANVCDPGLICINPEYVKGCQAGGCCTPWCDVKAPECPGEGQECLPWFEDGQAPLGFDNVGVCGVPQ
jgi:hypothetical protein